MQKKDLDFFKKWFLDYVDRFFSPEVFIQENIKLKIEHTARVCENILLLAKAEEIGEEGCRLAETIALFHDLGRFEQFTRYRTFKDSESENHALLGVRILENTRILSRLPLREKELILKAVEYHNLMEIPKCAGNSRELVFYSNLIRDADKLDILKLVSEDYKKEEEFRNPALEFNMPDTPGCSEKIVKDILNNRMAKLTDTRNLNDVKLLRVSWIFDISFPAAFAFLKESGYLETILYSMSETEEMQTVREHIESYLNAVETKLRNKIIY
ncbi:MAG TPA: HD domain-containing protein [Methanosarcina sp.]|nr:HD domain-containing protein [Methanosarcina sp.]